MAECVQNDFPGTTTAAGGDGGDATSSCPNAGEQAEVGRKRRMSRGTVKIHHSGRHGRKCGVPRGTVYKQVSWKLFACASRHSHGHRFARYSTARPPARWTDYNLCDFLIFNCSMLQEDYEAALCKSSVRKAAMRASGMACGPRSKGLSKKKIMVHQSRKFAPYIPY